MRRRRRLLLARRRTRSAAVARSWRAAEPAAPHLDGAGEPFPMLCPAAGDSPNSCVNLRQKSRSVFMRKWAKVMTTESALPAPPTASGCSRRVISVLTPPSCVGDMPRAIVMVPCSCAANMQMVAVCDLPPSAPSGAAAPACSARGGAPSGRDTGAAPARVCAVHPPRQQRVARDGQSARSRHDKVRTTHTHTPYLYLTYRDRLLIGAGPLPYSLGAKRRRSSP